MIVAKHQPDPRLAQLDRILASPVFAASERLARFLRFVVEEAVAGRGGQIKEYLIGVEVFDKSDDYDPRVDSTVRTEAGKLRARLERYYQEAGQRDPLLITIPKGSYVPRFEVRMVPDERPAELRVLPRRRNWVRLVFWGAGAAAVAVVLIFTLRGPKSSIGPRSLVRVTHDTGLTTTPALSREGRLLVYASDRAGEGNLDLWLQPLSGGEPLRLTRDPADESDPDFSPDGSTIAFRSERDGGGIYQVASLGGEPRLVAAEGRRPRYSPDGHWIAYFTGDPALFRRTVPTGQAFVVPASGGAPRRIAADWQVAVYPAFTPDSRHVLLWAYQGDQYATSRMDWFVAPLDGGTPIRTGVRDRLAGAGICKGPAAWPPLAWHRDGVLFAVDCLGSQNFWRIELSQRTWKPAGAPERVTFGSALEAHPAVASTGEIAFASLSLNTDIFAAAVDRPGAPQRLTTSAAADNYPSISADGNRLVYATTRSGNIDIWFKDLTTGAERPVAAGPGAQNYPEIAADGRSFTYHDVVPEPSNAVAYNHVALRLAIEGGAAEKLCENCSYMGPLKAPERIFDHDGNPVGIAALDPRSGRRWPYLKERGASVMMPAPSPDGRWLAFSTLNDPDARRVFVAPFTRPAGPPREQWKEVNSGMMPVWSPDSRRLHFASRRDGNLCVWSAAIDPRTGAPAGAPIALAHIHSAARQLSPGVPVFRWMSASRDKVVFPVQETSGNIWVLR